jgi:hypothetical protein
MEGSKISMFQSVSATVYATLLTLALSSLAGCNRTQTAVDRSSDQTDVPYGTKITFEQGGNADSFKVSGWSKTEEKFTWSEGTSAELRIPVAATDDIIVLRMRMAALFKPPELPFQPVEIYVNGQKIVEWKVGDTADFSVAIPHDTTKLGGVLSVIIATPKATSPKALGLSADPRILGICCLDLELTKG